MYRTVNYLEILIKHDFHILLIKSSRFKFMYVSAVSKFYTSTAYYVDISESSRCHWQLLPARNLLTQVKLTVPEATTDSVLFRDVIWAWDS